MSDFADLRANLETGYGLKWRTGDVVAGELHIRDRDRDLIGIGNSSSLEANVYRLRGDTSWDQQGVDVTIEKTETDGIRHWRFEPDRDDLWRVVFVLDGDYRAQAEITVRVHDPTDQWDPHAPGDTFPGRGPA